MDVALSLNRFEHVTGPLSLLVSHHFIRIAYEGALAINSADAKVGTPELADLLRDTYASTTARVRHLTKLFDDTKKSQTEVLTDLASEMESQHEFMTGNTFSWLR